MVADEPGGLRCTTCDRRYTSVDGVLGLLPDRLAHLATPGERGAHEPDRHARWVDDEMEWWNPWYEAEATHRHSPVAGLRGRAREERLFRHVRSRLPQRPLVLEMGAGSSRTIAGLMPPGRTDVRYVATDVSAAGLRAGRPLLGSAAPSVQCDAVDWPFREGVADVVLILGVLHHLSDWRASLDRACRTVRPGGFVLLHEAVTKPRILARFRAHGIDDHWTSPHEGDVPRDELLGFLRERGELERWSGEESPLRFALVRYVVQRFDLYARLERSPAMAIALNALDQGFGHTLGRVSPSLGFGELTAVWRR